MPTIKVTEEIIEDSAAAQIPPNDGQTPPKDEFAWPILIWGFVILCLLVLKQSAFIEEHPIRATIGLVVAIAGIFALAVVASHKPKDPPAPPSSEPAPTSTVTVTHVTTNQPPTGEVRATHRDQRVT
jgi:hypothetical protein